MAESTDAPTRSHKRAASAWTIRGSARSALAAGAVLIVYFWVLYAMPKHVFWSPDEGGRFIELQSIQWHEGLTYQLPYPARRQDPGGRFFPRSRVYPSQREDGAVVFAWPILFPLLSRIAFAAFGITGIYFLPLLSGWLAAVVSGVLTYKLRPHLAAFVILLVGLASPIFFYSMTFWEHTLATLLALLGVLVIAQANGRVMALFAAVLPILVACMLRLEMTAFLAALPTAVLIANLRTPLTAPHGSVAGLVRFPSSRLLRMSLTLVGIGIVFALVLVFVTTIASHRMQSFWWDFPFRREGLAYVMRIPSGLVEVLINSSASRGPVMPRIWAKCALGAVALVMLAPFVRRRWLEAVLLIPGFVMILVLGVWLVLAGQSYRALHGIIPIAPYVLVAGYVLPQAWRQRDRGLLMISLLATVYLLFGVALILLFYVGPGGLRSTLEWGQRYILTLYPLLAILTVVAVDGYWRSHRALAQRGAFAMLIVASIWIGVHQQIRGLRMLYANRQILAQWSSALETNGPIVTDTWWLATAVAPLFTTSDIFTIQDRAALGDWFTHARVYGVRTFTFASPRPLNVQEPLPEGVRILDATSREGLHLVRFEAVTVRAAR